MNGRGFIVFLIYLTVVSCIQVHAQKPPVTRVRTLRPDEIKDVKKDASISFASRDFRGALEGYLAIYSSKKTDVTVNYRIGYCYLNTTVDQKSKAIPYLEFVVKQRDAPLDAFYYMALAYHNANRFEEAIKYYQKFKEMGGKKDDNMDPDRQMEMCLNGMSIIKKPVNVTFENLGKNINTIYPDYNPFVSGDEATLVFSSKRKGNTGGFVDDEGEFPADVYFSSIKEGKWSRARNAGVTINTDWDEEAIGLTPDGKTMLVYMDNLDLFGDILITTMKGKSWQKPFLLGPNINTKQFETGATLSPDGNTLYFSSNTDRGEGGSDIYMAKRLPNDDFGIAVNLGPVVNSPFDDDAPFMFMDGKTLYFSSKGHNSMGGYDIFQTTWDSITNAWTRPQNLGYPINTADDNLYFSLSANRKYAYIASIREGGIGDLDIWKVTYKDVFIAPKLTVVKGIVSTPDSLRLVASDITLKDKNNHQLIGTYRTNKKGTFIMIVSAGTYEISIQSEGYQPYKGEVLIPHIAQPAEFPMIFIIQK